VVDAQLVLEQAVLGMDHVPDREPGELHTRLGLAIAGRGRQAIADRVGGHDEVPGGVQRLAGTDQEVEAMVVPRQRRDHQDGVRLLGIERAMRHVGDGEILDDLAALQGEVADLVELMGRIAGTVSGDGARERAEQHEAGDREQDEVAHRRTSALRVHGASGPSIGRTCFGSATGRCSSSRGLRELKPPDACCRGMTVHRDLRGAATVKDSAFVRRGGLHVDLR
jgi:hypothetical protein